MKVNIAEYQAGYANNSLRGVDITPRPSSIQEIAKQYSGKDKSLLDIGCGTSYKPIQLSIYFKYLIGIEPSPAMLKHSIANIQANKLFNLHLVKGVAGYLPFKNMQFDVITAALTRWNPKEMRRVLKKGGIVLIESLGPEDKKDFTIFFGKDKDGWRGANLNTNLELMQKERVPKFEPYFSSVELINNSWQTVYNKKGLWELLKKVKVHLLEADITFIDYFWTENNYTQIFDLVGFNILERYYPKATPNDAIVWQDELKYSPFLTILAQKPEV